MVLWIGTHVHASDAAWMAYATPKLRMISDLPEARAAELLKRIAYFDQVARHYLGNEGMAARNIPPVELLVFARRKDLVNLIGHQRFAAFTQPSLDSIMLVIGPSPGRRGTRVNAYHEYTHYLMRTQPLSYPIWYEEGLATLLGATQISTDEPSAKVGRWRGNPSGEQGMHGFSLTELVSAKDMQGWPRARMMQFYVQSAELVHFLVFGAERSFADRRAALAAHLTNRETDIFEALDTSPNRLSRQLRRYTAVNELPSVRLDLNAVEPSISVGPVTGNDTLRWQARAAEIVNPARSLELYQSLAAQTPDDVELQTNVIKMLAEQDLKAATERVTALKQAAGEHPAVLETEALLLTLSCALRADLECLPSWQEAASILRQALALDPNRQEAIFLLGLTELYTGNPGRAINYLRIVYNRAPWSPKVNLHLGECLRMLGSTQARAHLLNAKAWAYSESVSILADASLAYLDEPKE